MDKVRILDIASTDQGAYRLLKSRVKKINCDKRFDNYIVCPRGEWSEKIEEYGVSCIEYDVKREISILELKKEIEKLEKILQQYEPNIVHSHNSKTGALARIAVKNINKKHKKNIMMIHQVHGFHFTGQKGIKKTMFLQVEKKLAKYTDILLFQNMYEYNLCEKYGIDKKCTIEYIGNGINIDEFNSMQLNSKAKENFTIVCVARIEPIKNHMMLLQALNLLKEKYDIHDFKAIFIGEGSNKELLNYINENSLESHVIFTGALDRKDVINEIYNSDLSVLTSIKEGKPRALIESMLLGKPCIATNVIGTNEVVENNVTGYLVKLNDYEDLAFKIKELKEDMDKYNLFSLNCKKAVVENFDEKVVIEKIKQIYLRNLYKCL